MKIRILRRHIDYGVRLESSHCPIALAVKEMLSVSNVINDGEQITIQKFGHISDTYPLPEKAVRFTEDFDARKSVHPFTFTLPIKKKGGK